MFTRKDNVEAMTAALRKHVDIKILVVHPDSPAAALRSREPVYQDATKLIQDIRDTILLANRFLNDNPIVATAFKDGIFDVRATLRVPYCSYFIVDDLCYVSLYSRLLSGSSAPAFVFMVMQSDQTGYY